MKRSLLLSLVFLFCTSPARGDEPIIGGPCEGCENVFVEMPEILRSSARITPLEEVGEPMVIEGVVRTIDGQSAPGVIVYAYQTNAAGIYPKSSTRHGRLRAWARTDEQGRYPL